jgi:AraC family transcriptional regulator, regulatory protein of adaptative response / DNA-3-methyladenine glycosylase II
LHDRRFAGLIEWTVMAENGETIGLVVATVYGLAEFTTAMTTLDLDCDRCYQAVLTHDSRFDGIFFVGVSSTRIYCRTVCRARVPQRQNCSFYPSAAAAEQAGFRPCLLCRPELAPGQSRMDASGRLAAAVARQLDEGTGVGQRLDRLAQQVGVSQRHLRRVVQQEFGVAPVQLLQTHRLLLAKRLLTDTSLPIADVAYASGFGSVRRLNALFQMRYRLNPSQLRKTHSIGAVADELVCEVAYRPPLDWGALMQYLAGRAIAGVEWIEADRYYRTVRLGQTQGWLTVAAMSNKSALRISLSPSLLPVLLPILARVRALFDLAAEPQQIAAHLAPLADSHPGLRVPGAFDGFEIAVRTILGQQVSIKAATTLMSRFVQRFGDPASALCACPTTQLTHFTPTAERLASATLSDLTDLGILPSRANSILALAQAIALGSLSLTLNCTSEPVIAQLQTLPDIGPWTAHYIAMRVLADPDIFLHTDLGIRRALNQTSAAEMLAMAEAWRPWRSYATVHLWKSLEVPQ